MTYQICKRCNKMFEKNKELYCESCAKLNQKDYALITGHIRDNPGATVMEVVTATGASLKSINCFVEDGSFSYVENKMSGEKTFNLNHEEPEFKTGKFHGTMRRRR